MCVWVVSERLCVIGVTGRGTRQERKEVKGRAAAKTILKEVETALRDRDPDHRNLFSLGHQNRVRRSSRSPSSSPVLPRVTLGMAIPRQSISLATQNSSLGGV